MLVTPTLGTTPFDRTLFGPDRINGEEFDPFLGWLLTFPINMIGSPAASIPVGFVDGYPVGDADRRATVRRRGRDSRECCFRAPVTVAGRVPLLTRSYPDSFRTNSIERAKSVANSSCDGTG